MHCDTADNSPRYSKAASFVFAFHIKPSEQELDGRFEGVLRSKSADVTYCAQCLCMIGRCHQRHEARGLTTAGFGSANLLRLSDANRTASLEASPPAACSSG